MGSMADEAAIVAVVRAATVPRVGSDDPFPARFALELGPGQDPGAVGAAVERVLAESASPCFAVVGPGPGRCWFWTSWTERWPRRGRPPASPRATRSPSGLTWSAPSRTCRLRSSPNKDRLTAGAVRGAALSGFPPGCWVDPEPALESTPAWAIDRMQVPAAWGFSEQAGRPSRGEDVIVAQPDTGITPHVELVGVAFVPGFDVIDDDSDPTDPMTEIGNPGHGTGTASVLVSLASYVVTGSAPQARLMPIRAIESVVRIRQITVARAIDWAIQRRSARRHDEPWGHPRQRLAPSDQPSGRGGHDRPGRGWELRAPRCLARSLRRMHRCRCDERRRPALAGHLPRCAGGHLGAGPKRLPRGRAPRWPHRRRYRRPRAGHQLRGRSDRWSRRTVARSPRTSRRGRRCTCPRRNGPGDVPPAAAVRGPPTRAVGPARDGSRDRGCACTPRGEFRPGPWSRRCDPADRAPAGAPSSVASLVAEAVGADAVDDALDWHRFGPELAAAVLRRQLLGPPAESPHGISDPLARAISNPRLRDWLGLKHAEV